MKRLTWWRRLLLWLGRAELRAPAVEAVELAFDKVRVSRDLARWCPLCGCAWAQHNDDGSCVQEEDDS